MVFRFFFATYLQEEKNKQCAIIQLFFFLLLFFKPDLLQTQRRCSHR